MSPFGIGSVAMYALAVASWGAETKLSSTTSTIYGTGISAAGDKVHVVYGEGEVWYRRSDNQGGTWTAPVKLGDGTLHLTDPMVANGNDIWVIYLSNTTTMTDWCCARVVGTIWLLRSRDSGSTWDDPVQLTTEQGAFRVSMAYSDDRLHIVWMDYRSGAWDTYYLRSSDRGDTWDPEVVIAPSTSIFGSERPQIAARGNVLQVTLWDGRGNNVSCTPFAVTFTNCPDVFHMRSLDAGDNWSDIVNVVNAGNKFAGRNDIGVGDNGHVVINYNVDVAGETGTKLFTIHSPDDGATWDTPTRLTYSDNASDHGSILGAGLAMHLSWHDDRAAPNREIYYRLSIDGGASWLPEEQVSTNAAGDSSTPLVALTPDYVHVLWIDNRDGPYQVYYRARAIPETQVSQPPTDPPSPPPTSPPTSDPPAGEGEPENPVANDLATSVNSDGCKAIRFGEVAWLAVGLVLLRARQRSRAIPRRHPPPRAAINSSVMVPLAGDGKAKLLQTRSSAAPEDDSPRFPQEWPTAFAGG